MDLIEFVNHYHGKKVDFDNACGAQCVDLFRQYCKDVLRAGTQLKPLGENGGAKDLFLRYEELSVNADYFKKIKTKRPEMGDVVVFDSTPTNKYGHVAICLGVSEESGMIVVFEQNGFSQDGAKVGVRTIDYMLGVLRPKVWA